MNEDVILHLGCGNVYLTDPNYEVINVDIYKKGRTKQVTKKTFIKYGTTFDNYYKNKYDKLKTSPIDIIDLSDDLHNLQKVCLFLKNNNFVVKKIIAVQVLEHFVEKDVPFILQSWAGMLRTGGSMIISVPDMYKTASMFVECCGKDKTDEGDQLNYIARLIYGSQKDAFAEHKSCFWDSKLQNCMLACGLTKLRNLYNFHDYPAIIMEGFKC